MQVNTKNSRASIGEKYVIAEDSANMMNMVRQSVICYK